MVQVGADGLSDTAEDVVRSVAPQRAVIVGGISAVPTSVQERIETLSPGVSITRLAGADREETAVLAAQIALAGKSDVTVALANGWSLADVGVAASLVAAGGADAVLYTNEDGLSEGTAAALREASVAKLVAVGGLAALSQATADAAQAAAGVSAPQRLSGDTRVETAARVARSAAGDCTDTVVAANGWSHADVGTAATLVAALEHSAVLYAQSPDTAGVATVSALTRLDPVRLVLIGDTDTLSDSLAASLTQDTPRALTRYTDPADTTAHALANKGHRLRNQRQQHKRQQQQRQQRQRQRQQRQRRQRKRQGHFERPPPTAADYQPSDPELAQADGLRGDRQHRIMSVLTGGVRVPNAMRSPRASRAASLTTCARRAPARASCSNGTHPPTGTPAATRSTGSTRTESPAPTTTRTNATASRLGHGQIRPIPNRPIIPTLPAASAGASRSTCWREIYTLAAVSIR